MFKTVICFFFICLAPAVIAQVAPVAPQVVDYRLDQILVKPKPGRDLAALTRLHALQKAEVGQTFANLGNLQVVRVPQGETVPGLIARYQQSGLVEFAEPDHIVRASLAPNDPFYDNGTLWALNNTGQNGGTFDADIDGPEGWDVLNSASNIVVAVLDTGIRFTHEDLQANLWVNPTNGSFGYNVLAGSTDVSDDNGHGTLVSGVLGASGNNGKGVTGVAWKVQIMSIKCLNSAGQGSDSSIIAGIEFAITNGANVINASLDTTGFSQSVSNAIVAARDAGVILIASAGNNSADVDVNPRYPACYNIDNIVSVAFTTRTDALAGLSNYGATNVDLAAPGEMIHTTWSPTDSFYTSLFSGTSLAAPYVTGTFALMLAKNPTETHQEIIRRVLNATDPIPGLSGKCVTGGRLNLRKALSPPIILTAIAPGGNPPIELQVSGGPNRTCVIDVSTNLTSWSPLTTNTTSINGTFTFPDPASTNSAQRFYRATSTL